MGSSTSRESDGAFSAASRPPSLALLEAEASASTAWDSTPASGPIRESAGADSVGSIDEARSAMFITLGVHAGRTRLASDDSFRSIWFLKPARTGKIGRGLVPIRNHWIADTLICVPCVSLTTTLGLAGDDARSGGFRSRIPGRLAVPAPSADVGRLSFCARLRQVRMTTKSMSPVFSIPSDGRLRADRISVVSQQALCTCRASVWIMWVTPYILLLLRNLSECRARPSVCCSHPAQGQKLPSRQITQLCGRCCWDRAPER